MKIVVISEVYLPSLSGYAQVIKSLSDNWQKQIKDIEIHLLTTRIPDTVEYEIIDGVHIHRFKNLTLQKGRIMIPSPDMVKKISKVIKNVDPDQVHVHSRFSTTSLIAHIVSRLQKVPSIHVEHLCDHIKGESFMTNSLSYIWDKLLTPVMLSLSSKVVCVSASSQKFVNEQLGGDQSKTIFIQNGCNCPVNELSFQEKYKQKKEKNFFRLFFGARLVRLKNPLIVIEACRILKQKGYQNWTLDIAGSGVLESEIIKRTKDYNLQNQVNFLGKLPRDQMLRKFRESDIFINPSMLEGLCGTVMESMFSSCMPILTNVGGNVDVVSEMECLINGKNPKAEELAIRIEDFLTGKNFDQSDLLDRLELRRQYLTRYYTWEKVSKRWSKSLFNEI